MINQHNLITPEEAAEYLCVSVKSLAKWRSTGENNVPFIKVGRCARYSRVDLDAYLTKHTHNSVES